MEKRAGFVMEGYCPVNNGNLYYEISGREPWLVFIHGAWTSHKWWRWIIPEFSDRFGTLSFDLRGHGKSSKLKSPFSVEGFARDLDELLSYHNIFDCVLIGWSLGGSIAMQYSIDHPQKIKGQVLISTRSKKDVKMKLEARLFEVLTQFRLVSFENGLKKRFQRMLQQETSGVIADWAIKELLNNSRADFFRIAASFLDWNLTKDLSTVRIPSLVICGEKDSLVPKKFSEQIYRELPLAKLFLIRGCDHTVILDRPADVCKAVKEFIHEIKFDS
ncbi:MAG: alpha/beta hydrolase [Candidatus Jordarchaeaceae archaeon]